jgi:hypothetical protein
LALLLLPLIKSTSCRHVCLLLMLDSATSLLPNNAFTGTAMPFSTSRLNAQLDRLLC